MADGFESSVRPTSGRTVVTFNCPLPRVSSLPVGVSLASASLYLRRVQAMCVFVCVSCCVERFQAMPKGYLDCTQEL